MSGSPLASAHLNNSFERALASLDRCSRNLLQRKSLLTSRKDAQEHLCCSHCLAQSLVQA
jgi:hypothetical protein